MPCIWKPDGYRDGASVAASPAGRTRREGSSSGDTDPKNYAFLSDRVAVRAGQPQTFATQMECVNGRWLEPEVLDPGTLDSRRAAIGLPPYKKQLAQRRDFCRVK